MTLLDAHVHLWDRKRTILPWLREAASFRPIDRDFLLGDLIQALDQSAADGAVLVQAAHSVDETEWMLDLAQAAGDRLVGVTGWVDLLQGAARDLERLSAHSGYEKLRGIRHLTHVNPNDGFLSRSELDDALELLPDLGLVFELVVRPWQIDAASLRVSRHPSVQFVLDHLGKPPIGRDEMKQWRAAVERIARFPNVAAKISGVPIEGVNWQGWSDADVALPISVALEAFGPSRLMWGSDWPLANLVGGMRRWRDAVERAVISLTPAERNAVFAGTTTNIYGNEVCS